MALRVLLPSPTDRTLTAPPATPADAVARPEAPWIPGGLVAATPAPYAFPSMPSADKVSLATLASRKQAGGKFAVLTCYDYPTAQILFEAGVDVLLVGDTVAEVVLGYPQTRSVSMDFMIEVAAAVRRGAPNAFVIGDMPYSAGYHENTPAGVTAARRFVEEGGCDLVKIEMNRRELPLLEALRRADIDVMPHIGLRPQWIAEQGGYKAQAKDVTSALALIEEARLMEEAGASMLLLEAVAAEVSAEICSRTRLPVVGCVAGPACDGTVVVLHDMLGWGGGHPPRSVKRYAEIRPVLSAAFAGYAADVRAGRFPAPENSIHMAKGQYDELRARLETAATTDESEE
jgi:3-methyl-2-oxobutanoate hydroxymethyltransferase